MKLVIILVRLAGGNRCLLFCSTKTVPVTASISRYPCAANCGGAGMIGSLASGTFGIVREKKMAKILCIFFIFLFDTYIT